MSDDFRVILNATGQRSGSITKTIYALIYEKCYEEAVNVLESLKNAETRTRVQTLLAYCHYQLKNYEKSIEIYKKLIEIKSNDMFQIVIRLGFAQALYQCGNYAQVEHILDEITALNSTTNHLFAAQITDLRTAILFNKCEFKDAKLLLDTCPSSFSKQNSLACIAFKENNVKEALAIWDSLQSQSIDFNSTLGYNRALCEYKLRNYSRAVQLIDEIVELATNRYPELSVSLRQQQVVNASGILDDVDDYDCPSSCLDVQSVGNCSCLAQTALIEAFNLKAAIYYVQNQVSDARKALVSMPPRSESELDAVTLHNQAIINAGTPIEPSFEKLTFLLNETSTVDDTINTNDIIQLTFRNLLLMCCLHNETTRAETILNTYSSLIYKFLKPAFYELLEALLLLRKNQQTKASEKLDELVKYNYDHARKLYKEQQVLKERSTSLTLQKSIDEFKEFIQDMFLPTVMAQAEIRWGQNDYATVEKLLKKSAEFCSKNFMWNLNFAHVLFAQRKFQQALQLYKTLTEPNEKQLLNVDPVIVANLCVCYIMTSQNNEASHLIKQIHDEEELLTMETDEQQSPHSAIINLTIGILYCTKNNYEFGIARILSALEPTRLRLNTISWQFLKIAFADLFENMARGQTILSDSLINNCLEFLDNCSQYGLSAAGNRTDQMLNGICEESRQLKYQLLELV